MVTTPTALKSLVLKFLECAHLLDQSMVAKMEGGLVEGHIGRLTLLFEASSETRSRSERVAEAGGLRPSEIAEMRKEGAVAAEIVKLFQSAGVLILDEVDLILHPLRSELHWPLGRRVPLDFSKSRSGDGLRWKLPFSSSTESLRALSAEPPRRRRRVPTRRLRFSNASPRASTPPSRPRARRRT